MINRIKKSPVSLVVLVSLLLLLSACTTEMQQASQGEQASAPQIVIEQYVTQVVATSMPTDHSDPADPAPKPTKTVAPAVALAAGEWDPFTVQAYYPKMGCVASRVYVGDRVFVAYGADRNNLHYSENIGDSPIHRRLYPGEIMEVIDGPYCERGAIVWKVFTLFDEQIGFVAEGDGEVYWLLPLPPAEQSAYDESLDADEKFFAHLLSQGIQIPRIRCKATRNR